VASFLLVILASTVAAMVWVAAPPRSNHIGHEPRWLVLLGVITALVGVRGCVQPDTRRLGLTLVLAGVLFILVVLVFDYYNVLVYYERWTSRGMPTRWEAGNR
jgi:hypothetical protein